MPVGSDLPVRPAYSRRKKLIILAAVLLLMVAGMLATTVMLARSTPSVYQAWKRHLRQANPNHLQQQADQIEALLLDDLVTPLEPASDEAATLWLTFQDGQDEQRHDWFSHVQVNELGADEQGRPIRSIRLKQREINTWLAANFESWLEYRDFHLPEQIHTPMVHIHDSVSTLYFTVGRGSVSQVFQADFKIHLDEQGMANLSLGRVRAGAMPIPVGSLGKFASQTGVDAGDARAGPWAAKMQGLRFKPAVKLPDGLKGHLLDYQLQDDDSVILTLRIERYRPSYRKQPGTVAQADEASNGG